MIVCGPNGGNGLYADAAIIVCGKDGEDGFDLRCARAEVEQDLMIGIFLQQICDRLRQYLTECLIATGVDDVGVDRRVDDAVGGYMFDRGGVAVVVLLGVAHLLGEEEENTLRLIVAHDVQASSVVTVFDGIGAPDG